MRAKLQIRAVALILLIMVSTASGKLVLVDADSHAPGADISNVFPGVRLAALYEAGVPELDGKVYSRQAYDPAFASTGTNVFGNSAAGTDAYGKPRNETWRSAPSWRRSGGRPAAARQWEMRRNGKNSSRRWKRGA